MKTPMRWHDFEWDADVPPPSVRIMGVINVTPDSFSDGGRFVRPADAISHARCLIDEGADILDIGGESTRPGSESVSTDEQIERVFPVIRGIREFWSGPISIDTTSATVAAAAFTAGANWVNDISALRDDPEMIGFVAAHNCTLILMHRLGTPRTMQDAPVYRDVVGEVVAFLRERAEMATAHGVASTKIILDPGIGFGKQVKDNLALVQNLSELKTLGFSILVGLSRKSFLGVLTGSPVDERLEGSLLGAVWAVRGGASIVRVHDVGATRRALIVASALGVFSPSESMATVRIAAMEK